ncbi:DUF3857 domain-containing transglutaminase family protein [Roseimaritima ulvae]|uniref:DUF3857 domain-containing transglutaminase family protein n=1 Tax=Roseimaritima ulvae TaxID=980254 RepID=UPI0013900E8A|nr:DUF3857 domain-containing transglutaminase family protein [Roseimaritima ulvae]
MIRSIVVRQVELNSSVWGRCRVRSFLVWVSVVLWGGVLVAEQPAAAPKLSALQPVIDAGPLQATPEQLAALVQQLDAKPREPTYQHPGMPSPLELEAELDDASNNQILSSTHYEFLSDGDLQTTRWHIIRPQGREELADNSQLNAEWSPWHEDRPQLEARVITPAGEVIELDAAQIVERAAEASVPGVFVDRKALTALLSGVQPGAIIETKTVSLSKPLLDRSIGFRHPMTTMLPARVTRVVVSGGAGVRWSLGTLGPLPPAKGTPPQATEYQMIDSPSFFDWFEPHCGPQASSYPTVFAAVSSDWQSLGAAYGARIDQAITDGAQLAQQIVTAMQPAGSEDQPATRDQKIIWAIQQLQQMVRYTGLSLGENAILPVSPDKSLQRRFGDCKDQSTLLVAWLRQMDIPAYVALLDSTGGLDVSPDLACLDFFDHAIVAIPDAQQPSGFLFVDPTLTIPALDNYPLGYLTDGCRQRLTLICDAAAGKLVKTPGTDASSNTETLTNWMDLNRNGGGAMAVQVQQRGALAVEMGAGYDSANRQASLEQWRQYMNTESGTDLAGLVVLPLVRDAQGSHRFVVRGSGFPAQLLNTQRLTAGGTFSVVNDFLALESVALMVPSDVWQKIEDPTAPAEPPRPRRTAMVNLEGSTYEVVHCMRFPADVTPPPLPDDWQQTIGFLTLSAEYQMRTVAELQPWESSAAVPESMRQPPWQTWQGEPAATSVPRADDDQVLQLTHRCVVRPGTLSAAEVNQAHDQMRKLLQQPDALQFSFQLSWDFGQRLLESVKDEDLRALAELAQRSPRRNIPLALLGSKLSDYGMAVLARRVVSDVSPKRADEELAARVLLPIFELQHRPETTRVRLDVPTVNRLAKAAVSPFTGTGRAVAAFAAMRTDEGLLHADPQRLAGSAEPLQQMLAAPEAFGLPRRVVPKLEAAYQLVLLATRQDTRLKQHLQEQSGGYDRLLVDLLENRKPSGLEGLDAAFRMQIATGIWETMVATNRADLAWRWQNLLDDVDWPVTRLEEAKLPELPPLNEQDALSVVRHMIVADLESDVQAIQRLACVPEVANAVLSSGRGGPSKIYGWVHISEDNRSRWLTQTIAANAEVTLEPLSDGLQKATLKRSEDDVVQYWLIKNPEGQWRFACDSFWLGQPLWQQWQAGKQEQVQLACEALMPELAKELPMFDQFSGSFAARVWQRLEDKPMQRTEWTVRVMACQATHDLSLVEPPGQTPPPQIELWIQQLRRQSYYVHREMKSLYPLLLDDVQQQPTMEAVGKLLSCVLELQRLHPNEPRDYSAWLPMVEEYIDQLPEMLLKYQLQYQLMRVNGNTVAALDKLQAYLAEPPKEPLVSMLANRLLWDSLMLEDAQQVAKRLRVAGPLIDREQFATAHTLACAQALTGGIFEASEIYRRPMNEPPTMLDANMDLVRGLVAAQLGLSEIAQESFEAGLAKEPHSQTATVIRRQMKSLPAGAATP